MGSSAANPGTPSITDLVILGGLVMLARKSGSPLYTIVSVWFNTWLGLNVNVASPPVNWPFLPLHAASSSRAS